GGSQSAEVLATATASAVSAHDTTRSSPSSGGVTGGTSRRNNRSSSVFVRGVFVFGMELQASDRLFAQPVQVLLERYQFAEELHVLVGGVDRVDSLQLRLHRDDPANGGQPLHLVELR